MLFKQLVFLTLSVVALIPAYAQIFKSQDYELNAEILLAELNHPWGMSFLPDGRLLISERTGKLLVSDLTPNSSTEVTGLPQIREHGQGGLLDVLVHPNFSENRLIYLSYAKNESRKYGTEVLRATLTEKNHLTNITTIFKALPKVTGKHHFGSRLAISTDQHLYISLGDRGQKSTSQQLNSHHGSLIRVHDDGAIPHDNPFVKHDGAQPEIYSYGHRNIQGMTIRRSDQSLWLHEPKLIS